MWEKFYSKNGLAAKNIAKELMKVEVGEKIPRISDYCSKLSIGRGTVQSAFNLLDDMKAIKLEARGHLGTYLISKDNHLLLEIAGIAPLIGSMPLPYSRKYEGLATGIVEQFESAGKTVHLIYMRGGMNRIEAVRTKRSDFAIVSKMTADHMIAEYPNLKIFKKFGTGSYVAVHKVFLAQSSGAVNRVGVDLESLDQKQLTFAEFENKDVEYIHVNYMQLFDMLHSKQIDAAVWNADDKRMSETFTAVEFSLPKAKKISQDTTEAVIVIDGDREQELADKWDSVEIESILDIQKSVEKGEKIPRY
ncbi:GntR family transcriptional regulator YhfZ [Bacillus changyiensis]|uniref:GntR family transcriptional regulator YhfZ n=1 Tax=Bacillus changyiensis TaxID=3004103 RepID=UPI0022E7980A|nr:GntR family transcriptional regulator YhfZ [Bacillus changyiensis]MDA1477121.1 GntR family transcriptional regulator YhfZ [Bacillus changyiensis]